MVRFGLAAVTSIPGIVAVLASGCVGDDPEGGPSGTTDAGVSETATVDAPAPSRGCPFGCLPPAPEGWKGPSAIYDGPAADAPKDCLTPYVQRELDAHQGIANVPGATCNCGSGQPKDLKCGVTIENYTALGCAGAENTETVEVPGGTTCVARPASAAALIFRQPRLSGTCTYSNPTVTKAPPVEFDKTNIACGLAQTAACAERADCVATPPPKEPYTRLCIYKAGDEPCPSGDYAVQIRAFTKTTDERSCECKAVPTGSCGGGCAHPATAADCSGASTKCLSPDTCNESTTFMEVSTIVPQNAGCTPAPAQTPIGTVKSTEPVTICCNK